MLQVTIFAGLVVLCAVLTGASFYKKWCLKPFYVILTITAAVCLAGAVNTGDLKTDPGKKGSREFTENLYLSARLFQEGKPLYAVNAAGEAARIKPEDEDVVFLQALGLNSCGSFNLCSRLTEGKEDQRLAEIWEINLLEEKLDEGRVEELAEELISKLSVSENEKEQWEMLLHLRYYSKEGKDDGVGVPDTSQMGKDGIRKASLDGDYSQAYAIAEKMADQGDMESSILLSEMFVNNYKPFDYKKSDEEMDQLLNQVTKLQIELEAMEAIMGEESFETDSLNGKDRKEYELKQTEYQMALQDLDKAPVLRAINYLKERKPDHQEVIGYHLQMAKLYYLAGMEADAKKHLDEIFFTGQMESDQWLGLECLMFRDAFLESLDHNNAEDLNNKYNLLFDSLNQGIVIQKTGLKSGFQSYLLSYFRDLYTGIRIGELKVKEYPEIYAEISYAGTDELTESHLKVIDTKHEISSFSLEKKEGNSLAICFVLDKSGSMADERMDNAKNAINQFIANVDDGVDLALVTFSNNAQTDSGLTDSKAVITGLVNEVQASGGTNIALGLAQGMDVLQNFAGRKVIVLLSDGKDGGNSQMERVLGEVAIQDIPVYAIGLSGSDSEYMLNIANVTGGTYISADNSVQLYEIYQMIRQFIMNTYQLNYNIEGEKEERERSLRVELREQPSFDTKDYYIGLSGRKKEGSQEQVPISNFYRQVGGSYQGEELRKHE